MKPRILRMQNFRRIVQVLAFAAFLYLFLLTVGKYDPEFRKIALPSMAPIDTFFRIDPLVGLTAMIASRQVIQVMLLYALPVVVLSVVAGRFFCGWICPMGTAIDAVDRLLIGRRKSEKKERRVKNFPTLKYYVLIAVIVAAVFSAQAAYFFDPITIITRAFTFAIYPIVQAAVSAVSASDFASERMPFLVENVYFPRDVQYSFRLNFFAATIFVAILAMGSVTRRWWCRNLCPLGALLGMFSRFSIVRRIVKAGCINCGQCVPDCRTGAIMEDPTQYKSAECIYCYSCTAVCPKHVTVIAPTLSRQGYHPELDLDRRRVIQGLGLGAAFAILGGSNVAAKTSRSGKVKISSETLIRPPGSLPEDQFIDRCIRCSECMKVCPTNGIQPALTEAGILGLWTPVLVPRIGECTQNCNLCSQVCSTQAIQPFEIREKSWLFIGRAVIDRSQCIAWNSDKQCLVCDEHCSYHALYWKRVDGIKRPFVDEHKCVGCGICENACPIQPLAAIRVFSFGDQRHRSREEQKAFFELSRRKST